jgi:lipoprotein-anchoring transpeptidase ErfK/SrfK
MFGDYFVALDRIERDGDQRFFRTVRGRYVHADDVEPRDAPQMHGVVLSRTRQLPYAFVYGEAEAPLFELSKKQPKAVGRAQVHARFALREDPTPQHPELVPAPHGLFIARDRVRIARRIARPKDVPADAKWIHVNLAEQTLVAYEGDEPVFATLVSTGKEETGHGTPTGLFRIREKHVSVTMSGDDAVEGHYEVAEVPWTQFYYDSYALHGAYWHDTFGNTRSHGCTNISPPDARWLFHWTTPGLPEGFHARRRLTGSHVYVTSSVPSPPKTAVPR